ncbi:MULTISPECIES: FliM/FliN family flagellar motor switch protein [Rhizobiaceae]|jgi:flagellar motor switch protein FliM|uniref:Flagellar motor switch protein FliM n=1 Tax=Aliirhizobium cellulosilyticum TaxID=393664 RepID=A0A7W6XAQ3_9HYPH|nr:MULTISPECIES: FliM/FliN family flagellar motor switch protein [Rhizobium/Agrobacterium group]MBB4348689.1 flagellar motor switch protein FliM [Rhizobium cellulosilyticum]MBB4411925.1 flagellar motor switch protein FliM [Rhizobium cellulosilyticum]MBB4446616.1 flagellar motor switch protein FliM [Rhizobium cellulosilyticum]MBO0140262.1 flagellar motor switch protein FliM [Agrobacterium sp. Ap1]
MTSNNQASQAQPAMERALLARLTGSLGDQKTLERLAQDFGTLYQSFLPDVLQSELGLSVEVIFAGYRSGLMSELVGRLGDNVVLADATLRNWCPKFVIACDNAFVITLMENMLGATPDSIFQPPRRALSQIELDLSTMVFDKIAQVLRSGVNAPGGFETTIERPHNADARPMLEDEEADPFAMSIRVELKLGKIASEFFLVIPQKYLLKTTITLPKSKGDFSREQDAWSESMSEQVRRSRVTLEAKISLESLTLETISKLVAGDVIAFRDKEEIIVDVSANGREMYNCEFGRSGENYTVRVKDNVSNENDILKHLLG